MLRLQHSSSQGDWSGRQALVDRDFVLGINICQPWFSAANTCKVTMFTTFWRTRTLFIQTFGRHGGRAHLLCRHGGSDELAQLAGGTVNCRTYMDLLHGLIPLMPSAVVRHWWIRRLEPGSWTAVGWHPWDLEKKAMRSIREKLHGRIFALSPVTI